MSAIKQFIFLMKETVREWLEDGAAGIAAALAYYAIFSLSPLLILSAIIIGIAFDQSTVNEIPNAVEQTVGTEAADTVQQLLNNADDTPLNGRNFWGAGVWLAVIIWGASGLFAQLQNALNKIWEVKAKPGRSQIHLVKNRLLSFGIVIIVGLFLLSALAVNTGVNITLGDADADSTVFMFIRPLQIVVTLGLMTLLFGIVFKILPDVIIEWKDVWVGAGFTSLLFVIGQFLVGVYISNSDQGSVFGAAGSLTVILVWIYYSAQILLFGAEFTEVWARHHGASIRPDVGAVWINEAQARREAEAAGVEFIEAILPN